MRFIELHNSDRGDSVWVNMDKVLTISEHKEGGAVLVFDCPEEIVECGGLNQYYRVEYSGLHVRETPSMILYFCRK
jgi:hypothetical protein